MPINDPNMPPIFEFGTFADYFSKYLDHQKRTRRGFSYRQFCRRTGIKSAAMLTWMASGKRLPTNEVLEQLNEVIGWRPDEFAFVQSLVGFEKSKTITERDHYLQKMRAIAPPKNLTVLEQAALDIFLKWHIPTILEMTHLKDFKSDPEWISSRLGGKVSIDDVNSALKVLEGAGLIEKVPGSDELRNRSKSNRTRDNAPGFAVRGWHVEMMKLGQRAIHLQEREERFYSGVTLTIDSSKIKEIQAFLIEFRERFIQLAQLEGGDQTYHMGLQFFRLTETINSGGASHEGLGDEKSKNLEKIPK